METFIIYTQVYRNYYARFMHYARAIGYSASSCRTFTTGIKEFLCWLEKQPACSIDQVNERDIERYYDYLQYRPNTRDGGALSESRIRMYMYTLKLFFQYLLHSGQRTTNPMNDLEYTEEEKGRRENLLSRQDIAHLYAACSTARERAILGILYGCGLRRQEAVQLNTGDIHFRSAQLYVRHGKGGRKRTIPLSKTVLNDLKEYYLNERQIASKERSKDTAAFILNKHGGRMQGFSYREIVKKLIRIAKLDPRITPHHFRHAIATHLLESGMKAEHVKDFLGHASIVTTQTYTHLSIAVMKETTDYGTHRLPA